MKKKFSGPQIVAKLRQADILIGQGKKIPEVCKEIDVSENTYYRWRQKYGGMSPDMIKQHLALQKEKPLIKDMLKLSLKHPRYGYRRITILLREDSWLDNFRAVRHVFCPSINKGVSPRQM